MSEVTRDRTGAFLQKLFQILINNEEPMAAREAMKALQSSFDLSEYEKGLYPSGGLRFESIVRFATVDCSKAGWLRKSNGKWSITEAGKQALVTYQNSGEFYREAVRLYRDWRDNQILDDSSGTDPLPDGEEADEAKIVGVTFEQAEEQAWEEVAQYLHGINPYDFQNLVGELIKAMGYHVAWIAPPGRDGGVDILALKDPFGTQTPRIKIQVKRQKQTIAVDGLRSFMAILSDKDVGIFVSLGGFTKDAQLEARTQEQRRVTLIDLDKFFELWIEYYPKLSEPARQKLPIKPVYFLAPRD